MTDRALDAVLRLYPRPYRDDRGGEIAAVYDSVVRGGGRLERGRELLGIAGYGLRVRTGLTSQGTAGRLVALALPHLLGAGLGLQLFTSWFMEYWPMRPDSENQVLHPLQAGLIGVWALAVVAALAGRRSVARWVAVAALAGRLVETWIWVAPAGGGFHHVSPGVFGGWFTLSFVERAGAPLVWLALLLVVPPDLLTGPARRTLPLAASGVVLSALVVDGQYYLHTPLFWDPDWRQYQLLLVVLPFAAMARGRLLPAAMALGALPLVLAWNVYYWVILAGGPRKLVATAAGTVVLLFLARWLFRRPAGGATAEPPTAR